METQFWLNFDDVNIFYLASQYDNPLNHKVSGFKSWKNIRSRFACNAEVSFLDVIILRSFLNWITTVAVPVNFKGCDQICLWA